MTHRVPTTGDITEHTIAAAAVRPALPDKVALRRQLLAMRRALAPQQKQEWDALIGQQLWQWCQAQQVRELAIYSAIRNEPDLSATYVRLYQAGVKLCLPVVQQADTALSFARWQPDSPMGRDPFGVPVPLAPEWQAMPQHILIPCVSFNAGRFRLGYGGGFYDRTLASGGGTVFSVGIAYACQQVPFAQDQHDIGLSRILTEQGWM